jgi:uncharacterized protein YnzC (UPF0291/DUF896 family)
MIDWQSHMTPEEADEIKLRREWVEVYQSATKANFRKIRKIAERCRQRARKAKEKEEE